MISGPVCRLLIAIGMFCIAGLASSLPPEEEEEQTVDHQAVSRLAKLFDESVLRSQKPEAVRKGLEKRLQQRLNEIDKMCGLTPDQRRKLEQSGRLEIKRLFDILESRRREFVNEEFRRDVNQRLAELMPLRISSAGLQGGYLFRERSFLHKTALSTLSPDQRERYELGMEDHRLSRLLDTRTAVLRSIDHNLKNKLDGGQRKKLVALWDKLPCAMSGPVDAMVFMHLASRIPEEKYRDIVDDLQWEVLRNSFKYTQHYGPALVQLGVIDELPQEKP